MFTSTLRRLKRKPPTTVKLVFNGVTLLVHRKQVKYLRLKVHPHTGLVSVTAPLRISDNAIRDFLKQNQDWLMREHSKIQNQNRNHESPSDTLPLWGKDYPFHSTHCDGRGSLTFSQSDGFFCRASDIKGQTKQLERFYREQLTSAMSDWLPMWSSKLQVNVNFTGIKKMHTKWGSCNTRDKRIWLALELAKYPKPCAEMVFVHELVHLLERHHTPRFYGLMTQHYPEWRRWDDVLKRRHSDY